MIWFFDHFWTCSTVTGGSTSVWLPRGLNEAANNTSPDLQPWKRLFEFNETPLLLSFINETPYYCEVFHLERDPLVKELLALCNVVHIDRRLAK